MYEYSLCISPSNRSAVLDEELENLIRVALMDTNKSTNNKRYKRRFDFQKRVDDKTLMIKLTSESAIANPTGTLSSITRALIRVCAPEKLDKLQLLKYNNTYLVCTPATSDEKQVTPLLTAQTCVEILLAKDTLSKVDMAAAENAAEKITAAVEEYLKQTKKS